MFALYDYKCEGKIPRRLAVKLIGALGFGKYSYDIIAREMSLNEVLLFVDMRCPEPDPPLECALTTFLDLVCKNIEGKGPSISVDNLTGFYESIGRPPCNAVQAKLLLTAMLDFDDCDEPAAKGENFSKELIKFAKKNNLLKDLK